MVLCSQMPQSKRALRPCRDEKRVYKVDLYLSLTKTCMRTSVPPIADHPLRYTLANELHARPFPVLEVPSVAAYLAILPDGASRDPAATRAHLIALLDRYGAPHPPPNATHLFGDIGRATLKWENHTEFTTFTAFTAGLPERPFSPDEFAVFPEPWLDAAPGTRITSALIRVQPLPEDEQMIVPLLQDWFVLESMAVSRVIDGDAIVAGDFRIDAAGHMRFAVFVAPGVSSRRVGRIVQRLCEIETYKAMSMLGLEEARRLGADMGRLDRSLAACVGGMSMAEQGHEDVLHDLLGVATELESLLARSSFRFGATAAYAAIVNQRIEVMREQRFGGRQTFVEFMTRRFDPAMRTVQAAEKRLNAMADRAIRAGDLLRTRVDVARSAQNQALLASMDRRADLQLRLQHTVEGLSVVAISYYAVNLAANMAQPVAAMLDLSKTALVAALTPATILAVWFAIRRLRRRVTNKGQRE